MLALESRVRTPEESRHRHIGSPWNCLVTPEAFRSALLTEAARHHRYLSGFGLLRIGPREGNLGTDALREAFETETRRTDTACLLPDGSCALLALNAKSKHLTLIVRRLLDAAEAAHEQYEGEPVAYATGLAMAQDRRVDAEELWRALSQAYDDARRTNRLVRAAR